jgi:pimeloyl-ACP methyl ester carboxylesterase
MGAVRDACGGERAGVAGRSHGGLLYQALHLAPPERVGALVLLDTGPGYRSDAARAAWNRYAEEQAVALERDGAGALSRSSEVRGEHHRTLAGLPRAARGMLVQRDARVIEDLPAIRVPTLLIVGAHDRPFLDGMAYMARKIPGARYEIVEDAGHGVNVDQPARVNALLDEFLASLPG